MDPRVVLVMLSEKGVGVQARLRSLRAYRQILDVAEILAGNDST